MKTSTITVLGSLAALLILVVGYFAMGVSYKNAEVRQRNLVMAKQTDNTSELDNTMKTITQSAQVTKAGAAAIKDFIIGNSTARADGQGKGSLFAMVTEAVPDVNPTGQQFTDLRNTIVAARQSWTQRQKELIDIKRVHDNMLDTFPGTWFLAGREKVDIQIVTSTATTAAFETGVDDNVDLDL